MRRATHLLPALLLMAAEMLSAADLPDWFEANRVQAHCEMFRMQDESGGLQLHKPIADFGAKSVTLIVDNREEGAWWPSAVGETHARAANRDVAREIIESVHGNGMKCIGYYRYMSDAWAEREHPGWLCRDAAGRPVGEPRARKARKPIHVLCANSPYRDFVKTRLRELAQRGIDMIYFDSWHMPEVCTCRFCRNRFERETGRPFPLKPAGDTGAGAGDELSDADGKVSLAKVYSADYLEVSRFVSRSLVQAFTEWRDAVMEVNPAVRFAVGSSLYPVFLGQPQLTADFLAIADTSKTEFNKPFGGGMAMLKRLKLDGVAPPAFDIQTALGWSLVRDSSGGRPPLMWIPHLKTEEDALRASAAAYSWGCVASMAVSDIAAADSLFSSSFANGARVSPALAGTRPYGWAAVHISERARNRRLNDISALWKDVIAPAIGSFEALVREHVPVVTLNDRQMAGAIPDTTRVLVLASPDELTAAQQDALGKWTQTGGIVVRPEPRQDWHTADSESARMQALLAEVRARAGAPPVRISGPPHMHAACFRHPQGKRFVVTLVNAWDDYEAEARSPKPSPCRDVRITLDRDFFPALTATELLTGKNLPANQKGPLAVEVPDFDINRCVVFGP